MSDPVNMPAQSRRDIIEMTEKITDLEKQLMDLRHENELFRKALAEIEAEKMTIAYNQLGSAIKIRMLLQDQPSTQ